jgi:hypothetical protein
LDQTPQSNSECLFSVCRKPNPSGWDDLAEGALLAAFSSPMKKRARNKKPTDEDPSFWLSGEFQENRI